MMIRKFLFLFLLMGSLLSIQSLQAQDESESGEKKGFDPSKLFFGGNFGVSFGTYTFINVSPQAGYRFNRYLAAGAGINFVLSDYKYKDYNGDTYFKEVYGYAGLNIFGRVYPIRYLFFQVQPEYNYSWGKWKYYNPDYTINADSKFVPSLLLGAGAAIPTGPRGAFIISAMYDVIQNDRSPYGSNVFFSFGYNF